MAKSEEAPSVLRHPDVARKIHIKPSQWVGMAFLLSFPVLASLGVLSKAESAVRTEGGSLALAVSFSSQLRHKQRGLLRIELENRGRATLPRVDVRLPREYLDAFEDSSILPSPTEANRVTVERLAPGERREVTIELSADRPGRASGTLSVEAPNEEPLRVGIETLVFP